MAAAKQTRAKNRLESMKAELASELRERSGIQVEPAADPMDQILSQIDRENQLEHLQRLAERYRAIVEALRRIERGEYGICLDCEEKISAKRLQAIPWAVYCVSCQERRERLKAEMGESWDMDVAA